MASLPPRQPKQLPFYSPSEGDMALGWKVGLLIKSLRNLRVAGTGDERFRSELHSKTIRRNWARPTLMMTGTAVELWQFLSASRPKCCCSLRSAPILIAAVRSPLTESGRSDCSDHCAQRHPGFCLGVRREHRANLDAKEDSLRAPDHNLLRTQYLAKLILNALR